MNPLPIALRLFGGWKSIQRQVNAEAARRGLVSYSEDPQRYRFVLLKPVGFWPPRPAVNVKYIGPDTFVDLGRFVAYEGE